VHDDITNTKARSMRELAPDTWNYMNEADRLDPLFLEDFYGGSLEKLREVKRKYDPRSLFYCPTCVGVMSGMRMILGGCVPILRPDC
jgi:hypothetical protein